MTRSLLIEGESHGARLFFAGNGMEFRSAITVGMPAPPIWNDQQH